jgi:hypothetical protein
MHLTSVNLIIFIVLFIGKCGKLVILFILNFER